MVGRLAVGVAATVSGPGRTLEMQRPRGNRSLPIGGSSCPIYREASATDEIPATSAERDVASVYVQQWQKLLILPLCIGVLGALPLICKESGADVRAEWWSLGALLFALPTLLVWLTSPLARRFSRDLRSPTYLRTTGEIRYECRYCEDAEKDLHVVHDLRVAGRRLMWSTPDDDTISRLEHLSWGTIDYLKHSEVVLEIRDEDGEVVYRHPSYWPSRDWWRGTTVAEDTVAEDTVAEDTVAEDGDDRHA